MHLLWECYTCRIFAKAPPPPPRNLLHMPEVTLGEVPPQLLGGTLLHLAEGAAGRDVKVFEIRGTLLGPYDQKILHFWEITIWGEGGGGGGGAGGS